MNETEQPKPNVEKAIKIPVAEGAVLHGDLALPSAPRGVVLFAHGSGSSRHSPRNRFVAQVLQHAGLATLLLDLLTANEESFDAQTAALRFDIDLLARRLVEATWWLADQQQTSALRIGYFGASTGAAAALVAAAEVPDLVAAIVSRGGRPDLAGSALRRVVAPTLLIVGSKDHKVLELNRKALAQLTVEAKLEVIPGATHLFQEPGTLELVAQLAKQWFVSHLGRVTDDVRAA